VKVLHHTHTFVRPPHHPANGFSLPEVLIGAVLVALAISGAVALLTSGTLNRNRTGTTDRHAALIDADVANIQELARRYTWCSGSASFSGANCNGVGPGSEDYYFPDLDEATGEQCSADPFDNTVPFDAGCTAFRNACLNTTAPPAGGLLGPLISQIPTDVPAPELADIGVPVNRRVPITRVVAVDNAAAHRLRITYTYNDGANPTAVRRVVTLVPPVANWCPT
jgi:type II secretory pathway pseudopilin PulG